MGFTLLLHVVVSIISDPTFLFDVPNDNDLVRSLKLMIVGQTKFIIPNSR